MTFLEKDLEEILHSTDQELIRERGIGEFCYDTIHRQMNLGSYGIADLVTFSFQAGSIIITVYELKQDVLKVDALLQAIGYCRGLLHLIRDFLKIPYEWAVHFEIILIGKKIGTSGNFCFAEKFINCLSIYTYQYDFDGISFNSEMSYSITEASFPKDLCDKVLSELNAHTIQYEIPSKTVAETLDF